MKLLASILLMVQALAPAPATHDIDYTQSTIQFKGTHIGDEFTGKFESWSGNIVFDEHDLKNASIAVTIDMGSAKTGNKMYDGTLPQADWFAVKKHPQAIFKSTSIVKASEAFSVNGLLNLRNIEKPVSFDFMLTQAEHNPAYQNGHAELILKRLDFDIGKESDKSAEWVSNEIGLTLHMIVKKAE